MFNKLTNILQHAVGTLGPETSLHEAFVHHWKSLTTFYIENTDETTLVADTSIPSHLKQMLRILVQEESERLSGDTGPCMEYLLQLKILETLHTLGRADSPPGMKQQIFLFFKYLLGKIKQPLLPHVNVHRPVLRLVNVCGEVQAAPTEQAEVSFLYTVCSRLKQEPHLVHLFLKSNTSETAENSKNLRSANKPASAKQTPSASKNESYDLVDALMNLSHSKNHKVTMKACEGLLLLVSMPHEAAAKATVHDTALCSLINIRLSSLFSLLPVSLNPSDVESVSAKWNPDLSHTTDNDASNFSGKQALDSFLSWFDYCDQLVIEAYKDCTSHIANSIANEFLRKTVLSTLMQADERAALTSTAVLTKMFDMVRSKALMREFVEFIVPEKKSAAEEQHPDLLSRLLERCDHFSDEISVVGLRFFETMIGKPDSTSVDRLVLEYLQHRGYHAKNPGNVVVGIGPDDLECDMEPDIGSQFPLPTPNIRSSPDMAGEIASTLSLKMQTPRSVNCFLSVLPDSAKSTRLNDDGSGYDGYLREAHRLYKDVCATCEEFEWPKQTSKYADPIRCQPVSDYNEGPFLKMLLDKLSRMLSQSYNVNLIITSILSRLCLMPHPHLHELLVDPLTPLRPGARGTFSVIQLLVKQLTHRMVHVRNFKNRLLLARRKLSSDGPHPEDHGTTLHQKGLSPHLGNGQGLIARTEADDHQTFLEGAIVLEEFCKELSAIAFVKHHSMEIQGL